MIVFCNLNNLKSLFNVPNNPASTDLILTNRPIVQHSAAFETGLWDSHLFAITEFKTSFQKWKPKIMKCCDYKTLTTISLDLKYWRATLIILSNKIFHEPLFTFSSTIWTLKISNSNKIVWLKRLLSCITL